MKSEESPIAGFRGEYRFLSNFYPVRIMMSTHPYRSVEHAYQAAKTLDSSERDRIRECASPANAKRLGSKVTLQPAWESIKISTMLALLEKKFSSDHPKLLAGLLATGDWKLIEVNSWRDTFWGTSGGVGDNWLGKLLMRVRMVRRKQEEMRGAKK